MLKNYLKIALRNLGRSKGFSIINVSGLAIGMASALLILLWVQNELSYDRFYPHADRLYQAWNRDRGNKGIECWNVTPRILGPTLKQDYPEIEQASRLNWNQTILLAVGEKKINIVGTMVDPDFLTMFSFPFLQGNPNSALNEPQDMVITQNLAITLFGSSDAIGKTIRLDNKYDHRVSGVMADLPNNTEFNFEFLLPYSFTRTIHQDDSTWGNNSTRNYVLLRPNSSLAAVNQKIQNVIIQHSQSATTTTHSFLYPVSKLHLYGIFENGVPVGGKIETVRVFLMIALFILLIACINFMNMSTARSEKRAKEVGIRKVVGALRVSLVGQFLGESIFIATVAGLLALLLVQLFLPGFNALMAKHLVIQYDQTRFWFAFLGFILLAGIVAGSYPAFFLSSFPAVSILKGQFKKVHALVTPRKLLVVVQFTFAIGLIVCTLIVEKQLKYAQEREAGYDRQNLIYSFLDGDIVKNYDLIKNELLNQEIATSVTKTSAPLTEGWSSGGAGWAGKDPNDRTEINFYNSDGGLVHTAGLQLLEGRDMDLKNYPSDSSAVMLNESAAKVMQFKEPIGQTIDYNGQRWHVIGIVRDFILQSPYDPIKPMVICGPSAGWFNLMHIKLNEARSTASNIAAVAKIFRKYNPQYPFSYHFIDEEYARKFNNEQTTGILTGFFAGLTIFISCLGLFGLATYMAENRVKEIGIRKVVGASVADITAMLSRDFIALVFIAILIAAPTSWWAMDKWLSSYSYHVSITWWIFAEAGLLSILIAIITVSFQAIKAALANPVKSLRSE
jgi:putative ABC transport system permease protein